MKEYFTSGVIAAPMAGVTDAAQRHLCARYGADAVVTEMISAKGLLQRGRDSEELLRLPDEACPTGVQLFGADVFAMKDAANLPVMQNFEFIDINMGCPVPKVTRTGAGSALMKTIDRAQTLVRVAKTSGLPVTVKFRLGYEDDHLNYLDFGAAMQDAGAEAVTLHARTRAQGYAGTADWTAIAKLRDKLTVPVIANGDVTDRASYDECRRVTGCSAVMIGRAATGRPWIFSEVKGTAVEVDIPSLVREHYSLLIRYYDERYALASMRHFLGHYLRGYPGAVAARGKLNTAASVEEVFAILDTVIFC